MNRNLFDFSPAAWLPTQDKAVLEYCRNIRHQEMETTNENGDTTISFVGTPGQSNLTYEQKQQETFEPSLGHIFLMSDEPELVHKGAWLFWFLGILFCIITAYTVLFAKELFHHNMSCFSRFTHQMEHSRVFI